MQRLSPIRSLAFDSEPFSLIVFEQDSLLVKLLFEHLVLDAQVFNDLLLLTVDPASENDEVELPRLKNEIHEQCRLGEVKILHLFAD